MASLTEKKLYKLSGFGFGFKDAINAGDNEGSAATTEEIMAQLMDEYKKTGMRKTVEAVILVNGGNNHPHVMLLQDANGLLKLPGDKLQEGVDIKSGLTRILNSTLSVPGVDSSSDWAVDDLLGTWYRSAFEPKLFPYLPVHVKQPKEQISLVLVTPSNRIFAVPKNYKLYAVPLYELYDNQEKYGAVISSIPFLLSKYTFNMAE